MLTVRDGEGRLVRRLAGPVEAGFHRVAWDLRYPAFHAWKKSESEPNEDEEPDRGYLAAPGTYSVSLAKRVDGQLIDLGKRQTFRVVPLHPDGGTIPGDSPERMVQFKRGLADLRLQVEGAKAAIAETDTRLNAIRSALMRSTVDDASLDESVRALSRQLADLKLQLAGDSKRRRIGDPGPVSITRRIDVVDYGNAYSTHGPTATHRKSLQIAEEEFAEVRLGLDELLQVELPALEARLDATGVPWTPGRGVPAGASR